MKNIVLLVRNNILLFLKNKFMIIVIVFGIPILLWTGYLFSSGSSIIKNSVAIFIEDTNKSQQIIDVLKDREEIIAVSVDKTIPFTELLSGRCEWRNSN